MFVALFNTIQAIDKSPNQIFGGKPAATSSGSSRCYDGHGVVAGQCCALPKLMKLLDNERFLYAIRITVNAVLEQEIGRRMPANRLVGA